MEEREGVATLPAVPQEQVVVVVDLPEVPGVITQDNISQGNKVLAREEEKHLPIPNPWEVEVPAVDTPLLAVQDRQPYVVIAVAVVAATVATRVAMPGSPMVLQISTIPSSQDQGEPGADLVEPTMVQGEPVVVVVVVS